MEISYDYRDLFKALSRYNVAYLVVGAYAVAYYAEPRFTKDLDIWVNPELENAQRLYKAMKEFGAPLRGVHPEDFTERKMLYQIGVAPIRIDILMDVAGIPFEQAWTRRKRSRYGDIPINILGIKDLITSKKRFKREQDVLDLKRLMALRRIQHGRKKG